MPIYEYTCKACGAESEIMQKLSEPPAKECPVCHKKKLVKTISAAGFRLAGGGWYETDFKSGNKKNVAGDKDAAAACAPTGCEKPGCAATAETKSDAKSESKPEAKSDGKKPNPKAQAAA